jgi:hypothetical protein
VREEEREREREREKKKENYRFEPRSAREREEPLYTNRACCRDAFGSENTKELENKTNVTWIVPVGRVTSHVGRRPMMKGFSKGTTATHQIHTLTLFSFSLSLSFPPPSTSLPLS